MRKALLLLLVSFALGLCLPGRADADSIVSVQSPGPVNVASNFKVYVNISGAADVYGFQFDLGFNPTLVQVLSVKEGGFLLGGGLNYTTFFNAGTIDNIGGFVTFNYDSLIGDISGANGMGTLVQFNFRAIGAGTSALFLSNLFLVDSESFPLNGTTVDGSVTVSPAIGTPESSVIVYLAAAAMFLILSRRVWRIA
jgi:hypothetical protein